MPRRLILVAAVTGACALAAVATALAAGSTKSKRSTSHATRHGTINGTGEGSGPGGPPGPGGWPGPGGHGGVHSESVVLNKKGDGFITVTTDSGKIKSIDAGAGTIEVTEEANSVTYKTVTLTIPSGATVVLDGKSGSLAGLAAGDHVVVSSSSEGTNVFAADSSFQPQGAGHGGPPPGPGAPGAW